MHYLTTTIHNSKTRNVLTAFTWRNEKWRDGWRKDEQILRTEKNTRITGQRMGYRTGRKELCDEYARELISLSIPKLRMRELCRTNVGITWFVVHEIRRRKRQVFYLTTLSFLRPFSVGGRLIKQKYGALQERYSQEKPKYAKKSLSTWHFVCHKSHLDWSGIKHCTPQWGGLATNIVGHDKARNWKSLNFQRSNNREILK